MRDKSYMPNYTMFTYNNVRARVCVKSTEPIEPILR